MHTEKIDLEPLGAGEPMLRIDSVTREQWSMVLRSFRDASIFQTWDYVKMRGGVSPPSSAVLFRGGEAFSAALVRIRRIPLLSIPVAYIGYGPVWRKEADRYDLCIMDSMLDCLTREYVEKRGCYLRIFPPIFTHASQAEAIWRLFIERGFGWNARPDRTLLLDLSAPPEELRANINRKWRQTLAHAEKAGLEVLTGRHEGLYNEALGAYRQMVARKKFAEFVDKRLFGALQTNLDNKDKLRVLVARAHGATAAALAWSMVGDTGYPLLAATTEAGLKVSASYVIWWKMICDMKEEGARYCDFCGISPEHNPGGYIFKSGLAGKKCIDTTYLGQFDVCKSRIAALAFTATERLRSSALRIKAAIRK